MTETRPTADQIRFISAATGEHDLDAYLESAERGSKTIGEQLEQIFDNQGDFKSDLFEFRINNTDNFQFRVGTFVDPEEGWTTVSEDIFNAILTTTEGHRDDAQVAASAAAASAAAAALLYDQFDDRFLGYKSSAPTLDNDGNALADGALYFDTTTNKMNVYDLGNTTWIAIDQDSSAFKVSSNDTTPGFVEAKLLVSGLITASTQNDGGNETRTFTLAESSQAEAEAGSNSTTAMSPRRVQDKITYDTPTLRAIPQNSQSAAYTLVLSDAGKHIFHPAADTNTRTYTIPANSSVAYPVGTAITFINETSQVVTIAITTDTLVQAGTTNTGSRSLAQNGIATAIKITSTKWLISGPGLT